MQIFDISPIRIVLADDQHLVRAGLKAHLSATSDLQVVAEARNAGELLVQVGSHMPDVVVTEVAMRGMEGFSAICELRRRHPGVQVLVASVYDAAPVVRGAMVAGASGYVSKSDLASDLDQAVRTLMSRGTYFSKLIAEQMELGTQSEVADDGLTDRQMEVLTYIARGKASKEIASQLGLSPKTVDVHRSRIMDRLQMHDIASLTRYAVRRGLVEA